MYKSVFREYIKKSRSGSFYKLYLRIHFGKMKCANCLKRANLTHKTGYTGFGGLSKQEDTEATQTQRLQKAAVHMCVPPKPVCQIGREEIKLSFKME